MVGGDARGVRAAGADLPDAGARQGHRRAHAGPDGRRERRGGVPLHRPERLGPLRQDDPQRHRVRADAGLRRGVRRPPRRRRAGTWPRSTATPSTSTEIAELWRRGSVVSSWLLDLAAAALARDPRLEGFTGAVADSGRGALDGAGGGGGGGAGPGAGRRALRPLPLPAGDHLRRQAAVRHATGVRRPRARPPAWRASHDADLRARTGRLLRLRGLRRHGRPHQAQAAAVALQPAGQRSPAQERGHRRRGPAAARQRQLPRLRHCGVARVRHPAGRGRGLEGLRRADPLREGGLRGPGHLPGGGPGAGPRLQDPRHRRQRPLLPGHPARRVRHDRARPGGGRPGAGRGGLAAGDHREAVRPRPGVGPGAQPRADRASCARSRSTGSTTTWGRRRSRTCWSSASPTASSSRSGTAATWTASRSPWPRTWGWRAGATTTSTPAWSGTWCRTTSSSSSPWWPWSRPRPSRPRRCGTRR